MIITLVREAAALAAVSGMVWGVCTLCALLA